MKDVVGEVEKWRCYWNQGMGYGWTFNGGVWEISRDTLGICPTLTKRKSFALERSSTNQ